ncbi:MAG: sigma-70 family RNA polymerase sigma factor [Marinicella sp.]
MLEKHSDEKLMSIFSNSQDINNQRAFEVLYQRHKGPLYRFIKKSVNNEQDANELFQDLWFKIINSKQSYDPQQKFTTWAYTIARRLMIDLFRKNGISEFQEFNEELTNNESLLQLPEDEFSRHQMSQQLKSAIDTLPLLQRQAFVMKHDGGLSIREIAEITEQPQEQTKSQYRYAVKKLKMALERWL